MKYKVKAGFLKDKMPAFYEVLTNGTVQQQKPDGAEIVSAMKRAKITGKYIIEWYETCYCPSPLQHERKTVYDQYLANIETQLVETIEDAEGESFWSYLERAADMFDVTSEAEMGGRCNRYEVLRNGEPLLYLEVLDLWYSSGRFRSFFNGILSESPFTAYLWETPPVTRTTVGRPFEFVLVDSPGLARSVDSAAFHEHFSSDGQGIVSFENLGGDAMMVVPSPRGPDTAYGHLAAFTRKAPSAQIHALWESLGEAVRSRISDRPIWVSTAGGGVAWLHVRLDSHPKYYAYSPYKEAV